MCAQLACIAKEEGMRVIRYSDPFNALLRLQDALQGSFGKPLGWDSDGSAPDVSGRGVFPPVNVFSDENGYVVRLEVPGVDPANLTVELENDTLRVAGKRDAVAPAQGAYHRRERWTAEFSRAIRVPKDADAGSVEARYANGILTVRVPRREETKPRQITVSS
jgi:HSP20 family protein